MSPTDHAGDRTDGPLRRLTCLAPAGLLAAAGGIHLAALPAHLGESTIVGAFFAVTAAAQLLGAFLVASRPSWRTYRVVMAGNAAVLTLWFMSRTTGLPINGEPGASEPLGLLDGLAAAAELLVVVAAVVATVRRAAPSGPRPGGWRLALALALTWGISGGASLAVAGDGHHHGGAHAQGAPAAGGHSHEPSDLNRPADSRRNPSVTTRCPAKHDCTDHSH